MNKRSTALALALAALTSTAASADPIQYDFTMDSIVSGPTPGPFHFDGYFIIDDALMLSHGSGTLRTYDLEFYPINSCEGAIFGCALSFGQQYGNDLNFPGTGPSNPGYILHTPNPGAAVTFEDGVPTSIGFYQQHLLDRFLWRTLELYPADQHPNYGPEYGDHIYEINGNGGGSRGTYAIGAQVPVVPEPETWALLLGGIVALGAATRGRRSA